METQHVDVLIIGAGVSGIGAGFHLQRYCPNKTYAILEARENLGGTWDLFRYPGIRSDSDMYTFSYPFRPWTQARSIVDGPSILGYLQDTAREFGIEPHIRLRHRARKAAWSSETAQWTVEVERGADRQPVRYVCNFLYVCAGYFNHEQGYTPEFSGAGNFHGRIVHPQRWTKDIDCVDKQVIVIGSGATAVTLIPELAKQARHVVMLQRSPTYMLSWPAQDNFAAALLRYLPSTLAYRISRWKYLSLMPLLFQLSRRWPALVKRLLIGRIAKELGPGYDIGRHFTPRYNPWDQRLCVVPDNNLFRAIKQGKVSVVTDRIRSFTADGIALESGEELPADLVVTATGLDLQLAGGLEFSIDGQPLDLSQRLQYKGSMFSGVPNLATCFGYTNASWTLKADLVSEYLCRLLRHMDKTGARQCTPELTDPTITPEPFLDFSSGYITRAIDRFAKQGSRRPWKLYQNYALDLSLLRFGRIDDGVMTFSNPAPAPKL